MSSSARTEKDEILPIANWFHTATVYPWTFHLKRAIMVDFSLPRIERFQICETVSCAHRREMLSC